MNTTKIAERTAKANDQARHNGGMNNRDRGWFLHWRGDCSQYELCYRVAAGRWKKHRIARGVCATEADKGKAERYAVAWLDEGKKIAREVRPLPVTADGPTFEAFAKRWTSGELHKLYPDHVKLKKSADDDRVRLETYVYLHVKDVPIKAFTLDDADRVMRSLPPEQAPGTRRQVGQVMRRVLSMAVYPARIIAANPLPTGFLPKADRKLAKSYLYPDEDAKLMAAPVETVPLHLRLLFGFLAREGMRASEALGLTWSDLDLVRGAVKLDENKTDDPRAWALDPGVVRALKAWRNHFRPEAGPDDPVFVAIDGTPIDRSSLADRLRSCLRKAGVTRAELFAATEHRVMLRAHDLRSTFVTLSLANGKTEAWVSARTGHKSSQMINRYRRAANTVSELGLGPLKPLHLAIPEVARLAMNPLLQLTPEQQKEAARRIKLVAGLVAASLSRLKRNGGLFKDLVVGRKGIEPLTYGLKVGAPVEHETSRGKTPGLYTIAHLVPTPNGLSEGGPKGGRDKDRDMLRDKAVAALVLVNQGKVRAAKVVLESLAEDLAESESEALSAAI